MMNKMRTGRGTMVVNTWYSLYSQGFDSSADEKDR
jgi:hypothetical protein